MTDSYNYHKYYKSFDFRMMDIVKINDFCPHKNRFAYEEYLVIGINKKSLVVYVFDYTENSSFQNFQIIPMPYITLVQRL